MPFGALSPGSDAAGLERVLLLSVPLLSVLLAADLPLVVLLEALAVDWHSDVPLMSRELLVPLGLWLATVEGLKLL